LRSLAAGMAYARAGERDGQKIAIDETVSGEPA
jgi:hypothetical protein